MDGLMNALQNDHLAQQQESSSPHSPYYMDVSAEHHSPTDSSYYNDGSLSSLGSSSSMGGNHGTTTPVINDDGWFEFSGSLQSPPGGFARSPAAGFDRFAGVDHGLYASVVHGYSDDPQQRKQSFQQAAGFDRAAGVDHLYSSVDGYSDPQQLKRSFQQEMSPNTVSGSMSSCATTQSTNKGSVAKFSRDGSAGFDRTAGADHLYSSVHDGYSDPQRRKQSFQQEISQNTISGSMSPSGTQSTNEGSGAKFSRVGSVSSISSCGTTSGAGSSSHGGGSSMANSNTYMSKPPAGDYKFRQTVSPQQAQAQQRQQQQQQISSNTWSGQPQEHGEYQQQHQQHPQQPHQQQQFHQQQVRHQSLEPHQQQFHQQEVRLHQSLEPDPDDSGLRLVHLLLACAQSIQRGDLLAAQSSVMKINQALAMAPQQSGPMSRVAAHFAEALTKRIYGVSPNSQEALLTSAGIKPEALSEVLHFQYYETCPYLKFAHFTANQAILEAFKGAKHVHVIDFNLNHGLQWPALIQALAMRPGGPPMLRLTGIGPRAIGQGGEDSLKDIGMSLAQLAESVKVKLEFRGVVANKLDDIQPWMFQVRQGEVVAVNAMMQLHKLLYADGSNRAGIDDVLRAVRSLNPKIVSLAEQEANHNCLNFLDRFMEALHFYSSIFDSLEAANLPSGSSEQMLAEMYLGREICNIVACEGAERVERHETLDQWRIRLRNAGFQQTRMGPNAFKQASMLLTLFSGQGYRVEENQGCLTLCWHGRPLIAASAWHCP